MTICPVSWGGLEVVLGGFGAIWVRYMRLLDHSLLCAVGVERSSGTLEYCIVGVGSVNKGGAHVQYFAEAFDVENVESL